MITKLVQVPLQERLKGGLARCCVCERRCLLRDGLQGFCRVRVNKEGTIFTKTYGALSAIESRPIEIKPFFHFWPGSTALTFSTWSCNFRCPWCQNFHISTVNVPSEAVYVDPSSLVNRAISAGDEGLCASFNEPLMLFEYTLDVFRLGKAGGLYSTYVSNGYLTLDALNLLRKAGLDAIKIDVKGDENVYRRILGARSDIVWRNIEYSIKIGLHVEVVYLVVTGVSDGWEIIEDIVEKHLKYAGPDTPLHINRYYPAYKHHEPPTRVDLLLKARDYAIKRGINYVYIGNILDPRYEYTYCPNCKYPVIKRSIYEVVEYKLDRKNRCPKCGFKIPIFGRYVDKKKRWRIYA